MTEPAVSQNDAAAAPESPLRTVEAPSPLLQLMESRVVFELGAFLASSPLLRMVGRGDNHPVLVLPGFIGGDDSTWALRAVLRAQGYWVHGWGLGQNLGPTDATLEGIHARLQELHDRHGARVSLVGWSLGGIYAREMARENPDAVRQVITLGSPFRMRDQDRSAASAISDRLEQFWQDEALRRSEAEHEKPPLQVPSTAIYSRTDGVVRWHACIDTEAPQRENLEVIASHVGLGVSPAVIFAISDRLAQPEGDWRRFTPPIYLRHLYPRPASFSDAEREAKAVVARAGRSSARRSPRKRPAPTSRARRTPKS
ncbi:MAG: lipase family alpha/beta hydrolase [Acidimicrobiales bacterium]